MSHNVTPNTSRVELRKTLTLVPVVMMGLAYMQRSEERRVGKGVDLGGRRIIKKKNH